jgi:hypothetical protein
MCCCTAVLVVSFKWLPQQTHGIPAAGSRPLGPLLPWVCPAAGHTCPGPHSAWGHHQNHPCPHTGPPAGTAVGESCNGYAQGMRPCQRSHGDRKPTSMLEGAPERCSATWKGPRRGPRSLRQTWCQSVHNVQIAGQWPSTRLTAPVIGLMKQAAPGWSAPSAFQAYALCAAHQVHHP